VYLELVKGHHRTIIIGHFHYQYLYTSGTVRYEPVSAYQTSGTDLLIVPKGTRLQPVYKGIACIRDYYKVVSYYLGFRLFMVVFGALGRLLLFDGLE